LPAGRLIYFSRADAVAWGNEVTYVNRVRLRKFLPDAAFLRRAVTRLLISGLSLTLAQPTEFA